MSCFNKRLNKLLTCASFFAFTSAICVGQSSYNGLTPGKSTRADAERVLGPPVKEVSKTLVEYQAPQDAGRLYVQYRAETPTAMVERIELICVNKQCAVHHEKFRQSVRYVELDVRLPEPLRRAYEQKSGDTKATVFFGAPRYLRFVEIWKTNGDFENRVAFMSPELYESAVPKGGCTGSIFGTWEAPSIYAKDQSYFNVGRVTIERVGDDGIKGTYQKNNGTLTLRRAWENDQNFVYGRHNFKGEWKDDTGGGTIEIDIEGFNDFQTASGKMTRTSGSSQAPANSKNSKASSIGPILNVIGRENWRVKCVP